MKKTGTSIEPCGTPLHNGKNTEQSFLQSHIEVVLEPNSDTNQNKHNLHMSKAWSTVSKAFVRDTMRAAQSFSLSTSDIISLVTEVIAGAVLCLALKTDW